MKTYKIPLTKKDKAELLQKYQDFHLRPAPNNIGDETLVKAVQQIDDAKNPQPSEASKGTENTNTSNPETTDGTGTEQQIETSQTSEGVNNGETPKETTEEQTKRIETVAELLTERNRFFALNGKDAPESATTEQLKEQNDLKQKQIDDAKVKSSPKEEEKAEIEYDRDTQYLLKKGDEIRIVAKTTWDKFLYQSPDGWEKYNPKPKELQ
jgi:hypothetical protein